MQPETCVCAGGPGEMVGTAVMLTGKCLVDAALFLNLNKVDPCALASAA